MWDTAGRRDKAFLGVGCHIIIYVTYQKHLRCHISKSLSKVSRGDPMTLLADTSVSVRAWWQAGKEGSFAFCIFFFCICQNLISSFSQQSTVSFVVSQGTDQRLMDLDLDKLRKSSSSDFEKLEKSSELERDLPSELCKLRSESELSDLKLVKMKDMGPDQNSNCKSVENCAECVL